MRLYQVPCTVFSPRFEYPHKSKYHYFLAHVGSFNCKTNINTYNPIGNTNITMKFARKIALCIGVLF